MPVMQHLGAVLETVGANLPGRPVESVVLIPINSLSDALALSAFLPIHLRGRMQIACKSRQFTFVRRIRKTRVASLNPRHLHGRLVEATATTDGRQLLTHVDVHWRANVWHCTGGARRRRKGNAQNMGEAATCCSGGSTATKENLVQRAADIAAKRAGRPTNWPTGNSQTTVLLGVFLFFWGQHWPMTGSTARRRLKAMISGRWLLQLLTDD
jgi:hypothetical protein